MPDRKDLKRLVGLYYLVDYLFNTVSPRFQAEGTLGDYDFYAIVIWKSNRTKTKIKRGLAEAGMSLRDFDRALWARSWEEDLLALIGR